MLDIKLLRERPDWVRERLATRNAGDESRVGEVLALDEQRRALLAEAEKLKAFRNSASKEIGELMRQKKAADAEARKVEVREAGDRITALDRQVAELEAKREDILLRIPNLPHSSVAAGRDAADNPEIRVHGAKRSYEFQPKSHIELCEKLGLIDFARGTKLSGSGFLLYTGWGARLERALISFLLDLHIHEHNYTEVSPPFIIGAHCMVGVGQFPKFADQAYAVQEGLDGSTLGKLYLLPTAEAPVANIHREEILNEKQLPIRYVAYSPCFRAEAGAAGRDTRGMIRQHQFSKVELVSIATPETSKDELERMLACAEEVLRRLDLHYRVMTLCAGDMGFSAQKTYDIEVWMPGQGDGGAYREISSCSVCGDFQARRMDARSRGPDGKPRFVHTLNGSGTAVGRALIAVMETYQQQGGSIAVPEVLQPYMGGLKVIE